MNHRQQFDQPVRLSRPSSCRLSVSEGSRANVASQRPGQLGSEDVLRVAAQTSGPKHRQGRGGPEAERPQVLQRSDDTAAAAAAATRWRRCSCAITASCVLLQSLSRCCRGKSGSSLGSGAPPTPAWCIPPPPAPSASTSSCATTV